MGFWRVLELVPGLWRAYSVLSLSQAIAVLTHTDLKVQPAQPLTAPHTHLSVSQAVQAVSIIAQCASRLARSASKAAAIVRILLHKQLVCALLDYVVFMALDTTTQARAYHGHGFGRDLLVVVLHLLSNPSCRREVGASCTQADIAVTLVAGIGGPAAEMAGLVARPLPLGEMGRVVAQLGCDRGLYQHVPLRVQSVPVVGGVLHGESSKRLATPSNTKDKKHLQSTQSAQPTNLTDQAPSTTKRTAWETHNTN